MANNLKITKEEILNALDKYDNKTDAAHSLNMSRRSLYTYIKKLNINEETESEEQVIIIKKDLHTKSKDVNHFIVSDMQVGPNIDFSYLEHIALEIVDRLSDVVIVLGDWWDMTCLYNITKDSFDGKRYKQDVKAGNQAMDIFMYFINKGKLDNPKWNPRLVFTMGNHEYRIQKLVESYKQYNGIIGLEDLELSKHGFEIIPFLEPIIIDDVAYCHYFTTGLMVKPVASAKQMLTKKLMNCVMGHKQSFEMHREVKADGTPIYAIFAGSSYLHDEDYLGTQGNHYTRLVWALNNVTEKSFDPEQLLVERLIKKWNKIKLLTK